MFKVNNKDTRTTPMMSLGVFIVKFEHISCLVPVFLLLTFIIQIIKSNKDSKHNLYVRVGLPCEYKLN